MSYDDNMIGGEKNMEEILIPAAVAALGATYYGMMPYIL